MPCKPRNAAGFSTRRRKSPKYKDKDRYHCPFPGCARSCAELWRLKVHYRAPSNIRGSGVERGHGVELEFCPKCKEKLEVGKNHGQCRPPLASPRFEAGAEKADVMDDLINDELLEGERRKEALSGSDVLANRSDEKRALADARYRTSDDLSSFVSKSSLESGHPISAPEDHDLSVFSSPTCLTEALGLARPAGLKAPEFATLELEADVLKPRTAPDELFDFEIDDEAGLPGFFATKLEPNAPATQQWSWPNSDLLCTGPGLRLQPLLEPLDLAAYEANVVAILAARRRAPAFAR